MLTVTFPSYFCIDNAKKLILLRIPISVTLGLFDESFLVDPSSKEEKVIRGTLTCASDIDGTICLIDQVIHYQFISLTRKSISYVFAYLIVKRLDFFLEFSFISKHRKKFPNERNLSCSLEHNIREGTQRRNDGRGDRTVSEQSERDQSCTLLLMYLIFYIVILFL